MKRNDIIALVLILVVVLGIIIAIWLSEDEEKPEATEHTKPKPPSFFTRVSDRLKKIDNEITIELQTLTKTEEMRVFVDKKVSTIITWLKVVSGLLLLSIFGYFLKQSGYQIIESIINTAGLLALSVPVLTFFFYSKILTVEKIVTAPLNWVKRAVYKKYGYNPAALNDLRESISRKQETASVLREELEKSKTEQGS